jgi:hypothetical protein
MQNQAAADPLDLWRGIDDAVWREALRAAPPAAIRIPVLVPAPTQRRTEERQLLPIAQKVHQAA